LLEACLFKHMAIIKFLLKRNAVINKKNKFRLSVLDMSRRLDLGEVREYIEYKHKIHEAQRKMFIAISVYVAYPLTTHAHTRTHTHTHACAHQ